MKINQQPQIINSVNKTNNVNFEGISLSRIFSSSKDVVALSPAAQLNKDTLDWLNTRCKKFGKDTIQKAYESCLNSDSNISELAINLLKNYIPAEENKISKYLHRSKKDDVFSKFGLDFLSYMLQASKNDTQNHNKENIDFLDKVLTKFKSDKPTQYLDIIVNSKNDEGNVFESAGHLFEFFLKNENIQSFANFMKNLSSLPKEEQNFITKYYTKIKNNYDLFKILDESKGKDSSKIIKAVEGDLEKYDTSTILNCVKKANTPKITPKGVVEGNASLENYQKLITLFKNNKKLLDWSSYLKDNDGLVRDENITFCEFLNKLLKNHESIKNYLKISKDKNGVVEQEFAGKLKKVLNENSYPDSHTNIIYCIENSKNKKGEIQWDFVNILSALKNTTDKTSHADRYKIFDKTLALSKDNNGDIIKEIIEEYPNLIKNDLILEIPNILKISKINDKFNKDNYNTAVNIIKNTTAEDKYGMSEFLLSCISQDGKLDNAKIGILNEIQKRGIASNIVKLANALKNPNNTISQRGLNLAEYLRKNSHHQIEEDLPSIIHSCRDKSGYLNNKSIDTVKAIQKLKTHAQLSKLLDMTLDSNKEVDDNKLKVITHILKDISVKDTHTIKKIIDAAKDKNGVIDLEVLKLAMHLSKKGKDISNYADVLPAYRNLYKYEHVTHLSQLNLRQKRTLMRCLKRYNSDIQSPKFREILNSKILPNNSSEYCSILARLSHSIGTNVKPLSQNLKERFYKALKNLSDKKQDFMNLDFDNHTPVLDLTYPLNDFKNDVWQIVKGSHYSNRTKALDYFGFELKDNNGILELTGFPSADKPDGRLAQIKDKDVLDLIKKLTPTIIKFTENNDVTIKNHSQLSKDLTSIIKAFPEFLTTIGKIQHGTHDFTLDVHCLKVLQSVMQNPDFYKLQDLHRKHIQLIALLHDLTKAEGRPDSCHPGNSAFDVYYLLNKLGLKEKDKLKIYHVIKNHSWLAEYGFGKSEAQHMAFNMREGNSFKMLTMLTEADLKGVKKHDQFYLKHAKKLEKAKKEIYPYLYDLKKTDINLPQTKVPKASDLNTHSSHVRIIKKDGITNTVLELKKGMDLRKAGFKSCKDTNDINFIVHGLDNKDSASMFQALGMIDSKALLSTSYVNYAKGNYRVFRQEGFVLDVPAANIHVAYWRDFGSGYKKTIGDLYRTYLFQNNPQRDYISSQLKKELHINSKEYIKLFHKIEDMPMEELEVKYPKVARAYKKIFNDMDVQKRSFGRNYNEILVTSPKIQAIFCYDKNPESISSYLRKYAEKHDLPIIVFG